MESLARGIKQADKMAQIVAYLDNLYILTKSHAMAAAKTSLAAVFKPSFSAMVLDPDKAELFTPTSINPLTGQRY